MTEPETAPDAAKAKPKKSKKRIASLQDPMLEAIEASMFRFERESQAVSLMQRLSQQFVISKDQDRIDVSKPPTLKLWVRGYRVTEEEQAKGFRGHFVKISVKTVEGGKVTLVGEKQEVALKLHPQKERPKFRHPNWGHPILRAAQRGKIYTDIELARTELLRLHEEFPETSIPGRDKVHLMIYSRESNPPIRKCTVRISAVAEQGFKLELTDNVKKREEEQARMPAIAPLVEGDAPVTAPEGGKFTSMVALSRKKKPVSKKKPLKPQE